MGVFVFAAGIAVFSAKVWSTLNRRKKMKRAFLQQGIIPGYIPLDDEEFLFLTRSVETEKNTAPENPPAFSPGHFSADTGKNESFFSHRMSHLAIAVHYSDEFRHWEPDYTESSLPDLERWLLEYENIPLPEPPAKEKKRQTASLLHDIASYLIRTSTGSFPAFDHEKNNFCPATAAIMHYLSAAPTDDADRQLLLQLHYKLKEAAAIPNRNTGPD